ncbi:GIY-YIG nuclease family protein [Corynebacterium aquilae]|uniref:GIY-YIG domain-containing protein n=1 Tax=Corynebacterium aquilae DSM 44791 TaxID=1431546 RepID=A0A1L7CH59_9CORY|nr:GIY-YIG nuclease family protein [Corynebacterium aquilae]APT85201.1 hypothetical protein CAQU_09085 [Corynebacterium aquilae DSM 44791]
MELQFVRWEVAPADPVPALLADLPCRQGIYIIEFANGEIYVGQTRNILTRFATHVKRSGQHAPWADAVKLSFAAMPNVDGLALRKAETFYIKKLLDEGFILRNRVGNPAHRQPCALDEVLSLEDLDHWAAGDLNVQLGNDWTEKELSLARASKRTRLPQMLKLSGAEKDFAAKVLDDLALFVAFFIPRPVTQEKMRWTLTDLPSTAGGRMCTLNVGHLEVYFAPRGWVVELEAEDGNVETQQLCVLNMAQGTMDLLEGLEIRLPLQFGGLVDYGGHQVEQVYLPAGILEDVFEELPGIAYGVRSLIMQLMRSSTRSFFARYHSEPLASRAFKRAMEKGYLDRD